MSDCQYNSIYILISQSLCYLNSRKVGFSSRYIYTALIYSILQRLFFYKDISLRRNDTSIKPLGFQKISSRSGLNIF